MRFNPLLASLRVGPIRSTDYAKHAKSKSALKVRIYKLRKKGYVIDATPDPAVTQRTPRPVVIYTLVSEPE